MSRGNTTGKVYGPIARPPGIAAQASNLPTVSPQENAAPGPEIDLLDAAQLLLDLAGMLPILGAGADLLNAAISIGRGDYVGAVLSLASAVPAAGDIAGGAKIAHNADKYLAAIQTFGVAATRLLPANLSAPLQTALKDLSNKVRALKNKQAPPKSSPSSSPPAPHPAQGTPPSPGGGANIKPRPIVRMSKQAVKRCFKKNPKGQKGEFFRQLKGQEQGINQMTVAEYLANRAQYQVHKRKGAGTVQKTARAKHETTLRTQYEAQFRQNGADPATARVKAQRQAAADMKKLAALHEPDLIAGGKNIITGFGKNSVNSSIGAQWKSRVDELDKIAESVPLADRGNTLMNVDLSMCP